MKVLIVVPDGVGLRNYLYSSLIDLLLDQNHNVVVWHKLPVGAVNEANRLHHNKIEWIELPDWSEGFAERLLRDGAAYARLRINAKKAKNPTIMEFWTKHNPRLQVRVMLRLAEWLGRLISVNYGLIIRAEKLRNALIRRNRKYKTYLTAIQEIKPDVVFCTHQRAVLASPAMLAARQIGIKTTTAIFSWDNLPKGRMTVKADYYAVWSKYMKDEMKLFYPEISEDRVVITGTPQFECYKDERLYVSRENFAQQYGLNPQKKWICYSGDDQLTSPYDPLYLEDLLKAVLEIDMDKRPQVILRKAPVDKSHRFDYLRQKFPEHLVVIDPLWKKDDNERSFSSTYPLFEDVKLLVNLVRHCAVVSNVGSTMAHDFAQMNKPAFYINYDVVPNSKWTTKFIYKFQHFRSMGNLKPVEWINEPRDWAKMLVSVLAEEELMNDRSKWFQQVHTPQPGVSTSILVKTILSLD